MYAALANAILKGLGHEETCRQVVMLMPFFPTGNDDLINMPFSKE